MATKETAAANIEPNIHLLYEALRRQLANARAGTAKAKTRAEVAGGGRKPWRQKGTGRARAGSIRSPLWAGGGVIFGPKPRDYSLSMPKKMRRLAIISAFAARQDCLFVVEDFTQVKEAKTKEMFLLLKNMGLDNKKVLLVLDNAYGNEREAGRAARNIRGLKVLLGNDLNVKDVLAAQAILISKHTLAELNKRLANSNNATKFNSGNAPTSVGGA